MDVNEYQQPEAVPHELAEFFTVNAVGYRTGHPIMIGPLTDEMRSRP